MFLSPQPDLTPPQRDVTNSASTQEASNYNTDCLQMHGLSVYLQHFGVCWYNWNQPCVNETLRSPGLCFSEGGHSPVTLHRISKFL